MGDGTELYCPLCGEVAEYLTEEDDGTEHHTIGICHKCDTAFAVRTGVLVDEWTTELQAMEA